MPLSGFRSLLALTSLVVVACSESTQPVTGNEAIALQSGDAQVGIASALLPDSLRVKVTDDQGRPVSGLAVSWQVESGGGSVSPSSSVTGNDGLAATAVTLGSVPGAESITASAPDVSGSPVTFHTGVLAASLAMPADYGIHDTYVRDGLAFVFLWDSGLRIYDVGNGMAGGSPGAPALVGSLVTNQSVEGISPSVHNGWWFHNPATGEARYLFIGQEGPGSVGTSSTGDIHVVDVSDLAHPVEVAQYHHPSVGGQPAGTHNFWVDESHAILYAAYYNAGVVALDVSGTLAGDLSSRLIDEIRPGGAGNTYTWGVMLAPDGSLYSSDMLSGFWQLRLTGGVFSVEGGGNNVPDRFTSDLWVHGAAAYTGTWGTRGTAVGNEIKVWSLGASGAPSLSTSVTVDSVGTISDLQVSEDGTWLMVTAERGPRAGLYLYSLADPLSPAPIAFFRVGSPSGGIHTGTIATIGGRTYVFAARDPSPVGPALLVFDVTSSIP